MTENEVIETARAAQEVAKTVGKGIDLGANTGKFTKQVFGDLVVDAVGLVADRVKFYRMEKFVHGLQKAQKILEEIGVEETRSVLPKFGLPIIDNMSVEDDESLHDKWAKMLANAMNPGYDEEIRHCYITILGDMNPTDASILDQLVQQSSAKDIDIQFSRDKLIKFSNTSSQKIDISLRNLLRLGCIKPGVQVNNGINMGGQPMTTYKDIEIFSLTQLGLEFHKSIS